MPDDTYAVCCMCKTKILYGTRYYRCSVTACNAGRMKLVFCSPACWNAHLPTARLRNASCVEGLAARAANP